MRAAITWSSTSGLACRTHASNILRQRSLATDRGHVASLRPYDSLLCTALFEAHRCKAKTHNTCAMVPLYYSNACLNS